MLTYWMADRDRQRTIKLYNPNHDAKGRFTTGGGAASTVAKGQGRTKRGEGGKRVNNVRTNMMTHEQVGKAVEQAIQEYGTSANYAHATDVQASMRTHYGMNKDETNAYLNALRDAGARGESHYTLHYERDEENWRSGHANDRLAPLMYRGNKYDYVELSKNGVPVTNEAKGRNNPRFR